MMCCFGRYQPYTWGGLAPLVSGGIILLSLVGVFCRRGNARVWWLGFSLFGGAYLAWAYVSYVPWLRLPTHRLLEVSQGAKEYARAKRWRVYGLSVADHWQIAHGLITLVLAFAGGAMALAMFGIRRARPENRDGGETTLSEAKEMRRLVTGTLALGSFFGVVWLLGSSHTLFSGPATGLWNLLAASVVGIGVLGACSTRGRLKERCLGIAVFGGGYVVMAFPGVIHLPPTIPHFAPRQYPAYRLPSDHVVNFFRSCEPPLRQRLGSPFSLAESNRQRIIEVLEKPLDMPFPNETPLDEVLRYIRDATRAPDGSEIPIYVEPVGLQEAEKTMTSPVSINLKGVPLKATLSLLLDQLGLEYRLVGGVLRITSQTADEKPVECDEFLAAGHCLLALLAAGAGGIVAPFVSVVVKALP